ncbi:unnamed protein product [Paramecium primaurelia]|uniref:Uncharacterized protein n=1 Tax=Paramecium primaurelia TaxID=5886 RepID=A0A8S1NG37_PARPR|nr:unnamed protein product [Paramecium primaurelia]
MTKYTLIFALLLICSFGKKTIYDRLHGTHIEEEFENEIVTEITMYEEEDPKLKYEKMMNTFMRLNETQVIGCRKTDHHEFFGMFFQNAGRIGNDGQNNIRLIKYEDDCYESMRVSYETNEAENRVCVTFTPGKYKNSQQCSEFYLIGTTLNYNIVNIKDQKEHRVYFNFRNQKQVEAFKYSGAYIFRTCDYLENWFGDLLMTLELFFGGFSSNPYLGPIFGSHPPDWMVRSNIELIERATGYRWQERPNVVVDLKADEVNNGDFLAVTRFDGLDQIIEWGTGGRIGHSAMIFEIDGEKYVIESQDAWYWPTKKIQKTKWEDWKVYAKNAGFNVAVLPLSPEKRAQWDQEAAMEYWKKMEGQPYGYHTFLFGWIDTPKDNYPKPLSAEFATYLFSFIEKIAPGPITSLVGEALNKRLGTEGLSVSEIAIEAAKQGIELSDLYAMVERDEWIYSDGPSQACAAFVTAMYKAAGLFKPFHIEALEFTPKDIYQLKFFDSNYVVPEKCKINDPDLPYCQLMGTHRIELEWYNTVEPYENMNQRCPSIAPEYIRPDGC